MSSGDEVEETLRGEPGDSGSASDPEQEPARRESDAVSVEQETAASVEDKSPPPAPVNACNELNTGNILA